MTAERWTKVRALLDRALAVPATERAEFLRRESEDPELIAEVERLLPFEHQSSVIFSIEGWQQRVARTAADASLAGTLIGSYRLLDELGRGGMGAVYLAERADGVYQQKVAIKVLQENIFTPALAERFRQERQILARLQHPGIARLLDGGVMPDGRPYLVLEYVDGLPIDRYCDENKLDVDARLRLFLRVAEVVQSAHQQLVLHLDLKPANILVTLEGEPRLLDFGIARILSEAEGGSGQTEATLRLLTPRYASPEQAAGDPLGVASDVFSLATLLYRLLTGKLPYPIEDSSPLEAARMLREVPPVVPSQAVQEETAAQLRGDVDMILLQALRKEPERRYPTVAAFAEDVERHLALQPVLAHADTFGYRAGKFWRRNRAAVIAAAVVVVILMGSGAAVVRSAIVARIERATAERERATAERRLKDVRALAHSYIFDLDPKLEQIPGTANVRNFILQNGLKYLEAMSKEAVDDEDLTHELSKGYVRIGRVQGDATMPSLSNRAGAWDSISKGVAMEKRLFDKDPSNLKQRGIYLFQLRIQEFMASYNGDLEMQEEIARRAWDPGQPILAAGPNATRYIDMPSIAWDVAMVNGGNADVWNYADPVEALRWLDRMRDTIHRYRDGHPDEALSAPVLGHFEREASTRAWMLIQVGRSAEAGPLYEESLRNADKMKDQIVEVQTAKVIRAYYAGYLLSQHKVKEAAAMASNLLSKEYRAEGSDRSVSSDDADALALLARIDLQSGRVTEGRRKMQRALDTLEVLYKSDPEDASSSSDLAWDTYRLAGESALDPATRKHLYQRPIEIATLYAAQHPRHLSAAMLIGKCEVGLAELAAAEHDQKEQKLHAGAAAEQFAKVLAAHPVQPEASTLLAYAKTLAAG